MPDGDPAPSRLPLTAPTLIASRPNLPPPGAQTVTLAQVASLLTTPAGASPAIDATLRDGSQTTTVTGLLIETRTVGCPSPAGDLPQYEPIELLGSGGMGAVVAARQNCLGRRVALKRIHDDLAGDERLHQLFLSEAALTAQLVHPNIPQIYEMGLDGDGRPFYTMQEIRGRRWEDFLHDPVTDRHEAGQETPESDSPGPRSLDDHLDILLQVCNAIAFAHSRGIIHRDIKPANVMLGSFGQVSVMDWGLAAGLPDRVERKADGRPIANPLSPATAMGGTPAYMAPEMARALVDQIDEHSDVYLLGGVLFRILTGHPPHEGEIVKECLHQAANNRIRPTTVDNELMHIARRALATRPEERYPDVAAFREAVRASLAHRESSRLERRAREAVATLSDSDSDDAFRHAQILAEEAVELWPDSPSAPDTLHDIRLSHAAWLLDHDEIDAAGRLLGDRVPADHPLRRRYQDACLARARRARRSRQVRILALLLAAGLVLASSLVILDYSKRQASWREVAHIDFTRPGALTSLTVAQAADEPRAVLYDGDLAEALPPTASDPSGLVLDPKCWVVITKAQLGDADRIRLLLTVGREDAIEIGFGARIARLRRWYHGPAGYGAKVVTKIGSPIALYRNDQDAPIPTTYSVPNNRDHLGELQIDMERTAGSLSLAINGTPVLSRRDTLPLSGFGFDGLCIRFHRPTTRLRALTLWHRGMPERASPLVAGDSLVVGGHYTDAALTYHRIAKDFHGQGLEPVALLKTCLAADRSLIRDPHNRRIQTIREAARDRLATHYPDSSAHRELLANAAREAWRQKEPDRALELAAQVLASGEEADFLRLLVASRPQPLSTDQVARIVHLADRHGLRRLVLSRCEITELPDCRGLALDWLDLSDNRLQSIAPLVGARIARLGLARNQLTDLSPLAGMDLELLDIAANAIVDLVPLAGQPLHTLNAGDNQIADLAPLTGMPLRSLHLANNPLIDLAAIADCPLTRMDVSGTGITSIAALADKELITCAFENTAVTDLEPIRGAPLRSLDISGSPVGHLGPLSDCRQLAELSCSDCDLTDLGPLTGLPLFRLHASHNRISDTGPLRQSRLRSLDLSGNDLATLPGLSGLPLVHVNLANNRLVDINGLHDSPLHTLTLDHNQISDLTPLTGAPLDSLRLDDNRISDLTPLRGLPISNLAVSYNPLTSLAGLEGMPLSRLNCRHTPISDLGPLAGAPLTYLDATACRLTDLRPLAGMPIENLRLAHNQLTDCTGLEGMTRLRGIDLRDNHLADLTPLFSTRVQIIRISGNPIGSLAGLESLPLDDLECFDCGLTSLEPFVSATDLPARILFGPAIPTEELRRCREIWATTSRSDLVRQCDLALARQQGDVAALQALATTGPDGFRHLLLHHPLTRAAAESLATRLDASILLPRNHDDLTLLDRLDARREEVWIARPPPDLLDGQIVPPTAHDIWHTQFWVGLMPLQGDADRQRYGVLLSWPPEL